MPYSAFNLSKVKNIFQLIFAENQDLFPHIETVSPSEYLNLIFSEHLPLVTAINTQKARSELIIMPVLIEVKRYFKYQISVFSGSEFNVDPSQGLEGRCDFILSIQNSEFRIQNPESRI